MQAHQRRIADRIQDRFLDISRSGSLQVIDSGHRGTSSCVIVADRRAGTPAPPMRAWYHKTHKGDSLTSCFRAKSDRFVVNMHHATCRSRPSYCGLWPATCGMFTWKWYRVTLSLG